MPAATVVDLGALTAGQGFTIQGDAPGDNAGFSVSGAGDVNGDGIDDVIIGARSGDNGGSDAGEAYVIYGRAGNSRGTLDLTGLTAADGFVIQGDLTFGNAGFSVSSAGDVNNDGIDDLIVGAPFGDDGTFDDGEAYVIYGQAGRTRGLLDVASLTPAQGFTIQGNTPGFAQQDQVGFSVSSAGDVNNDGIDDLIVGAPNGSAGGLKAGQAYVIYGQTGSARGTLDLASLTPAQGFIIQGDEAIDQAANSVSAAGDVNGDGIDDLIIGAAGGPFYSEVNGAYVVYGKAGNARTTVDLTGLAASDGFFINGDGPDDVAGFSVSSAGDVNGDGIDDLIVGAPRGDDGGTDAGEAYVIYGQSGSTRGTLNLTSLLPAQGFAIRGDAAGDGAGYSVSAAGDVNGDGFDDLIVGAFNPFDHASVVSDAYVIYGKAGNTRPTVDLTGLSDADGFIIRGDAPGDQTGRNVSGAGDVDGDGVDDLIVGAPNGDDGGTDAGEAYVIYGGSASGFGRVVDLSALQARFGFVIQGDRAGDQAGRSVSDAGDVNGDGIGDLIVGAPYGDNGGTDAGEAYVIYGQAGSTRARLDLSSLLPTQGFIIQGDVAGDWAGISVSSAGDVNGDGIDDLIVGATRSDVSGGDAGEAYVIYGQAGGSRPMIDLSSLAASDGFKLRGANEGVGVSVSSAGDVNGDGIDDLIMGTNFGDVTYVIFGKAGSSRSTLDLSSLDPSDGFVIQGDAPGDNAGFSVSDAGDVNGDGIDDLIVGARFGDDGSPDAGEAYVVYGKAGNTRTLVDLTGLAASDGFIIRGDAQNDQAGYSVSSAGDVNGDGIDDLIVGAPRGDNGGGNAGEAYVVYGQAGSTRGMLDLTFLTAAQGFLVQGDAASDEAGFSVSSAGDVNADGIKDLIVGARSGDAGGFDAGSAYVIFGQAGRTRGPLDLTNLSPTQGFTIQGDAAGDRAGWSVSAAGDVNGDGIDDLIVGAPEGDDGGSNAGEAYVIYGRAPTIAVDRTGTNIAQSISGGTKNDSLRGLGGNDTLNGGAGNDTLNGGTGNDSMLGGAGNDTYTVDAAGDKVIETKTTAASGSGRVSNDAGGIDTVLSAVAFNLNLSAGVRFVENLSLTGTANINGIGNALNNRLTGNAGNNVLNGGLGNDTMIGGAGDDTYVVDAVGDEVFETTTPISVTDATGIDTVQSAVTFNLDASAGVRFVENLTLTGTDNIDGTGNALANRLTGNAGNNVLNGGLGNDTMIGGAGNDTYVVETVGDRVFETTTTGGTTDASGVDVVQSAVSFNIDSTAGVRFVENLVLTGTASINGTGNALANTLTGNAGSNVLKGGLGKRHAQRHRRQRHLGRRRGRRSLYDPGRGRTSVRDDDHKQLHRCGRHRHGGELCQLRPRNLDRFELRRKPDPVRHGQHQRRWQPIGQSGGWK